MTSKLLANAALSKTRSKPLSSVLGVSKAPPSKSFSESVTPELLENLPTEEVQRQELIYEFIHSERQYVQELNKINEHIIKPIIASKILGKTELSALFSNFNAILVVHQTLLEDIDKMLKEGPVLKKFGEALVKQADLFASYLVYASNFPLVKSALEQYKEKIPAFNELYQKISSKPEIQGNVLSLLSILIIRVLKYPDLIQNILNQTPPDHADHKDTMDALTKIRDNVDMAIQGNNSQQMSELQKRLDPNGELDLVSPNRKFVREGSVVAVLNRNTKKKIEAEMVVCNDMILFTKKTKGAPKIFKALNIASCQLHPLMDDHNTELEDGFELISEGESVGVYLPSKDEKESWLADLEPYVDLAKGVDRPVILYAGGTKGKKKGIKSISRALVPRVFSKKGPESPILSGNIFIPAEHRIDSETDGSSGHHDSTVEGADSTSTGNNDQLKPSDQAGKGKGKQALSATTNSTAGLTSQSITSNAAGLSSSNNALAGASAQSVLGEERVVKQIVIPRNLPLGIEMEIKHLSAKLQKRVMKCNELRKQVSVINERKNQLEKDLDLLQKSEKHAQIRSIADDLLTGQALLCYELQQMRWFTQQLNKAMREKAIVERDLEKIKLKLEKKHDDPNKPKKLNEEDVTKLLVNMVAFETEKSKLCEIEKNRLAETCAGCLKTVKTEYDRNVQEKEATLEKLSKVRLDLRVEIDRSKALQQENQLLKSRFAEAEQVLSQLSVSELEFVKESLLKYLEEGKDLEEEEELDVAGEDTEPASTTSSSNNLPVLVKTPSETDPSTKEPSDSPEEKKSNRTASTSSETTPIAEKEVTDEERKERRMSISDMFKKKDKKSGSATKSKKSSGSKRDPSRNSRDSTSSNEGTEAMEEKKG
eukprot:TRINITY_DN5684_c0_g1_i1.p1 TRINITY_DN5684_c0_g1~~TRINITY_DN5684_c0_g1_i1.p1  ORF type:complete len:881 (-),score=231.01 TRINITY_DN5684_c0_g1_i1:73-2715(-)